MTIVDMTTLPKEKQLEMLQEVLRRLPTQAVRGVILSLAYEDADKDRQVRDYFVGHLPTLAALVTSTDASLREIISRESGPPPGELIH
jgi:hypothetical protein